MESKVKHQYDALLALRAPASVALTADTDLTKISLDRLTAGRGDLENRYGLGSFDVVVYVTSIVTGGMVAETYDLKFQTYDSAGANAFTHMTHRVTAAEVGEPMVFTFHPQYLAVNDTDAAKFSINLDVTGTGPSIVLYAFCSPHSHA